MKHRVIKGYGITMGLSIMVIGFAHAKDISGVWVDGAGMPIKSGDGSCVRSGSWSVQTSPPECNPQPTPGRVVLLPDPEGKVGAVIVQTQQGQQILEKAYAGVAFTTGGALETSQETAASVDQRFGAVLQARPMRPVTFVVHFASGSSTDLTPESRAVIEQVRADLSIRPAPEIMVIGHTDRVGSASANDELSLRRAETVKAILKTAGLNAVRIEAVGRGERDLPVSTADEVAEPLNRAVDISIR